MKKNLIYASDIDETILFPGKKVTGTVGEGEYLSFPDGDDRTLHMSKAALDTLKKIHESVTFIPVTSRSIEQYLRIPIFKNEIKPKFAIVSNGGNIIVDGVVDEAYRAYFLHTYGDQIAAYKKAAQEFIARIPKSLILRERLVDDSLYIINLTGSADSDPLIRKTVELSLAPDSPLDISIQSHKLHIIPTYMRKEIALKYLADKQGLTLAVAAGDAMTDLGMLKDAQRGIVPATGELYRLYGKEKLSEEGLSIADGPNLLKIGEETLLQAFSHLST